MLKQVLKWGTAACVLVGGFSASMMLATSAAAEPTTSNLGNCVAQYPAGLMQQLAPGQTGEHALVITSSGNVNTSQSLNWTGAIGCTKP